MKLADYKLCTSLLSKVQGLMFSTRKNVLFVFKKEQRVSLHMLFVFFPIWALYLSKEKKVIYKIKLYPFISFCYPKVKAKYILELVNEPKVRIGEKVEW